MAEPAVIPQVDAADCRVQLGFLLRLQLCIPGRSLRSNLQRIAKVSRTNEGEDEQDEEVADCLDCVHASAINSHDWNVSREVGNLRALTFTGLLLLKPSAESNVAARAVSQFRSFCLCLCLFRYCN